MNNIFLATCTSMHLVRYIHEQVHVWLGLFFKYNQNTSQTVDYHWPRLILKDPQLQRKTNERKEQEKLDISNELAFHLRHGNKHPRH